jgi:hypothetical protein
MNETRQETSIWTRLDELSDEELNAFAATAANVVADASDDPSAKETLTMPPGPAARELQAELGDADAARTEQLLSDPAAVREMNLTALRELAKSPELAAEIEEAWRARGEMMFIDGGLITGTALLLLIVKLKRVRAGKGGVDVEFYEAKNGVIAAIGHLLGH